MFKRLTTVGSLAVLLITVTSCSSIDSDSQLPEVGTAGTEGNYRLVWDNFRSGFTVNSQDAKWFYFAAGPYVGDDGIVTTSSAGLRVVSSGTNPTTGKPAFVRTLGQEGSAGNPGLPGGLDHVKWLVYMNNLASSGYPGFDAVEGQELVCETTISGQSYGTSAHPFGRAVRDPNDDLRLGATAMNTVDFDTFMVFDFFLTNEQIYAFYERLPFARDRYGNYAAFSFEIPVAKRRPTDDHNLKIAYDKAAGTVRWLINDVEVHRVTKIGHLINRRLMTIDHGGTEETVTPNQLNCGMGMFTLLDGHKPSGKALVRLSNAPDFYFDPSVGQPTPLTFVDESSQDSSRLFGQGVELRMRQYVVSSRPSK